MYQMDTTYDRVIYSRTGHSTPMMQGNSDVNDCLDELAVKKLFIFLKGTLNIDYLQDEFFQRNLLSERELKEYVLTVHGNHFRSEKFLKLIIKKRQCHEFVACMRELPEHEHVYKKILEFENNHTQMTSEGSTERTSSYSITDEMLNRHFHLLLNVLEPRVIADEMFQEGQITVNDHDHITDDSRKYNRMKNLLDVLKRKQVYACFACTLESLHHTALLNTLTIDTQYIDNISEHAVCVQHNFTTLQDELPEADHATAMMENLLDESDLSDIQRCRGTIRQKAKLLKILILKGHDACRQLFNVIRSGLRRGDLIQKMINKNTEVIRRGIPNLEPSLCCLTISCLERNEDFLYEDLEPLDICDFLFEEGAVDIPSHDGITERSQRRSQIQYLLETVQGNEHDCFRSFLYILHREGYTDVCQRLVNRTSSRVEVDGVQNERLQLRLTVQYETGEQIDQILYQHIHSFDTSALKEIISRGKKSNKRVTSLSVVLQIRPVTDKAVSAQLNGWEIGRVLRNLSRMLEKAEACMAKVLDNGIPWQLKIQVIDSSTTSPKTTDNIRRKINSNYKNILDEMQLRLARETLSKCIGDVDEIRKKILPASGTRRQRMDGFLQFILQHKENLIEFERILKINGLKTILDTWTENVDSRNLQSLLESFDNVIPNYPKGSIAKTLLEGPLLTECFQEVRSLAKRVVLSKNCGEQNNRPGRVIVYEVVARNENNGVIISEKDPEDRSNFFDVTRKDLVKVILVEGIWQSVSKTMEKVYQNYQEYIDSGMFHLHHESEQYVEVAKLSAIQKIDSYKQYVESITASIPLDNIQDIVKKAVDRALTEERIKQLCHHTHVDGIGKVGSSSYYVRFFLTLHKIKSELKEKTIESIKECLGSEICAEIQEHLTLKIKDKLQLDIILDALNLVSTVILASMLLVMTTIINPVAGVVAVVATGLITFFSGKDVNSRSWRDAVAMEIFNEVSNNKVAIIKELSSHLWKTFHVTTDHLKTVAGNLKDYSRRITYFET